tara:strand:- start:3584 stop:3832 length:249 start_codon:yes stop_codon:yes gene_type:complete
MPTFRNLSIEEAMEATKSDKWLSEEFGEELELPQCPECEGTNLNEDATVCWDCTASEYEATVAYNKDVRSNNQEGGTVYDWG